MKILQTVFDIMDYGGIVNHVELLARGFEELGHKTEMCILRCSDRDPHMNKKATQVVGSYTSGVANQVNTISGWYGANVYSYGSARQLKIWERYANQFDLIIHQLPVPKADPDGYWLRLYDHGVPQIAIAHDAHFRDMYPHMIEIAPTLIGVSVTNPAGYEALRHYPGLRTFIGAPHVPQKWEDQRPWRKRPPRFVSAHVWKAWKHMDTVVRAIPYLPDDIQNVIGGDGIEGRYMRSIDKCKPKYEGIWQSAINAGMDYRGLLPPALLMEEYTNARLMVDMSYSKKFAALGNHFNRSTIEAYNGGCVPLVTDENMFDSTAIFDKKYHYVSVPKDISPKDLASAIEDAAHMPWQTAERIVEAGRDLLSQYFHYRKSAHEFVRMAKGKKDIGIYGKLERGHVSKEVRGAADEILRSNASAA